VSILPTLCWCFRLSVLSNRSPLTDRRANMVAYPYLSLSSAPTDSRIKERCIGRNWQRIPTVMEWVDPIVLDSPLRGEAVWCCPHSAQAAIALATGALPRPPRAGSSPGSTCTPAASLETIALGNSLGCSESGPSLQVTQAGKLRAKSTCTHAASPETIALG
jgi:hypothetical protein